MPRTVQRIDTWASQLRPEPLQQAGDSIDFVLDVPVQAAKLRHEIVVETDRPTHESDMRRDAREGKNVVATRVAGSRQNSGGRNAWGIQYHVEQTPTTVDEWGAVPAYAASPAWQRKSGMSGQVPIFLPIILFFSLTRRLLSPKLVSPTPELRPKHAPGAHRGRPLRPIRPAKQRIPLPPRGGGFRRCLFAEKFQGMPLQNAFTPQRISFPLFSGGSPGAKRRGWGCFGPPAESPWGDVRLAARHPHLASPSEEGEE